MNRVKEEIHMKEYIKNNWKFLIFVLISGLIGGSLKPFTSLNLRK